MHLCLVVIWAIQPWLVRACAAQLHIAECPSVALLHRWSRIVGFQT